MSLLIKEKALRSIARSRGMPTGYLVVILTLHRVCRIVQIDEASAEEI